jgi:outer membrane protein assembly factor BamB
MDRMASRRDLLAAVAGGLTAGFAGCPSIQAPQTGGSSLLSGVSWSQLGHDAANTRGREDVAMSTASVPQWEISLQSDTDFLGQPVYSAPVTDGFRIYVTRSGPDPAVISLSPVDGSINTVTELTSEPVGTPALVDDTVVVALRHGVITAFDQNLQNTIWTTDVGVDAARSAIVADMNRIYLAADGVPGLETPGGIVAVDVTDGKRVWACPLPDSLLSHRIPAIDSDGVYVAGVDRVYGMGRTSGEVEWETPITTNPQRGISIAEDTLFLCGRLQSDESEAVIALAADSGDPRWSRPLEYETSCRIPAVGPDRVYVKSERRTIIAADGGTATSRERGQLEAFAHTGDRVWQTECPTSGRLSPVLAGSTVSVLGDGGAHLYDRESGDLLWKEERPNVTFRSSQSLTPAGLTAVSEDGRVISGLGGSHA